MSLDFSNIASSAQVMGDFEFAQNVYVAQGVILRSLGGMRIGADTALLENGVFTSSSKTSLEIGSKTVFGHRCFVSSCSIGDLCEIGNGSIILSGAKIGDHCILGEGTLILAGQVVPSGSVVVGRPGRAVRRVSAEDDERIKNLRGGDVSLSAAKYFRFTKKFKAGAGMGKLYKYRDKIPVVDPGAVVFDSAEITGDVQIGAGSIIGSGVKIIGDSHGPVRLGRRVQILENTVLHLLPDNELVIGDDVIVGPGSIIHGCRIGAGSVIEAGSNVCDFSKLGQNCLVRAGSVVKQRSEFGDDQVLEGMPARVIGENSTPIGIPPWAFDIKSLPELL